MNATVALENHNQRNVSSSHDSRSKNGRDTRKKLQSKKLRNKNNKYKEESMEKPFHPENPSSSYESTSAYISNIMKQTGGHERLASLPKATLQKMFQPVLKSLEELDAEALLDLQRVPVGSGARLRDGVNVQPIHSFIEPRLAEGVECVRYIHISEIPEQYSCGIFVFPPYSKIPLHDHPEMCVLSRLLYGDIQCLSLDLVPPSTTTNPGEQHPVKGKQQGSSVSSSPEEEDSPTPTETTNDHGVPSFLPPGSKKALKNSISHLYAPAVTMLFPMEGNLHEFFAGPQGAAIIDILVPPYDAYTPGRDCYFYDIYDPQEQEANTAAAATRMGDLNIDANDEEEKKEHSNSIESPEDPDTRNDKNTMSSPMNDKHPIWLYPIDQPEDFHCLAGTYGKL